MCTVFFFFFIDTATTEIYTLSLRDALPISHLLFQEQVIRTAGLEDGRRSVSGDPNSVRPFARVLEGAKATPKVMLKQLLRASALPGSCDALCRGGGHSLQGRSILSVRYEECRATVKE